MLLVDFPVLSYTVTPVPFPLQAIFFETVYSIPSEKPESEGSFVKVYNKSENSHLISESEGDFKTQFINRTYTYNYLTPYLLSIKLNYSQALHHINWQQKSFVYKGLSNQEIMLVGLKLPIKFREWSIDLSGDVYLPTLKAEGLEARLSYTLLSLGLYYHNDEHKEGVSLSLPQLEDAQAISFSAEGRHRELGLKLEVPLSGYLNQKVKNKTWELGIEKSQWVPGSVNSKYELGHSGSKFTLSTRLNLQPWWGQLSYKSSEFLTLGNRYNPYPDYKTFLTDKGIQSIYSCDLGWKQTTVGYKKHMLSNLDDPWNRGSELFHLLRFDPEQTGILGATFYGYSAWITYQMYIDQVSINGVYEKKWNFGWKTKPSLAGKMAEANKTITHLESRSYPQLSLGAVWQAQLNKYDYKNILYREENKAFFSNKRSLIRLYSEGVFMSGLISPHVKLRQNKSMQHFLRMSLPLALPLTGKSDQIKSHIQSQPLVSSTNLDEPILIEKVEKTENSNTGLESSELSMEKLSLLWDNLSVEWIIEYNF